MNIAVGALIYPENPDHPGNILDVWNLGFSNANVKAKDVFMPTEKSMALAPIESRALYIPSNIQICILKFQLNS